MRKHYSRYKRPGWRGESYRHYLAAKGVRTKRYFAMDMLKGNRPESPSGSSALLHAFYQEGWSDDEILARKDDPRFAAAAQDVMRKREARSSKRKFDVPEETEVGGEYGGFGGVENVPNVPLRAELVPEERGESASGVESVSSVPTIGKTVMTPGVPPPQELGGGFL